MSVVVISLIILGGMGLLSGVVLAIASRFFTVEVDPRIEKLEKILPGVNCGGCGFPSCFSYAQNIIEKGVEPNCCVLGADIDKISQVLGKAVVASEKKTAAIKCYGGDAAVKEFDYNGMPSCRSASLYGGGDKLCKYSCLGFGDCVRACPFAALSIVEREAPLVNHDKCTGCGKCTAACPRGVIILIPRVAKIHLACNSKDKGKVVRQICELGCIGCERCLKVCPENALSVQEERVAIDYQKCTGCGLCIEECPRDILKDRGPQEAAAKVVNQ